jgi:glycosyltransferase involved in cell wall biosynthesis
VSTRILLVVENVSLARDHRLRKQVLALQQTGVEVSVICPTDEANSRLPGVTLYEYHPPAEARSRLGYVREYGLSFAAVGRLMLKAFMEQRYDAVQIAGNPDIYFVLALPLRLLGRPLVFDQRDPAPELYRARYGGSGGAVQRILLALERASYRTAHHVLVVNQSLRAMATGRGHVPAHRVTIVGNGPRLERPSHPAIRIDLKKGRRHLGLWLGFMGPQDSVDLAVRAVAHLVHVLGRTDCQFAFVGDGETRPRLRQLAAELQVQEWVDFPGWVDENDAAAYLVAADIGLEPNMETIVSPVKVQEYMGFGLPVVAFDLAETRELAESAGVLVPPGDVESFAAAIATLLDDRARRAALGAAGRRRVEAELAWELQSQAYLAVWNSLIPSVRQAVHADAEPAGAA